MHFTVRSPFAILFSTLAIYFAVRLLVGEATVSRRFSMREEVDRRESASGEGGGEGENRRGSPGAEILGEFRYGWLGNLACCQLSLMVALMTKGTSWVVAIALVMLFAVQVFREVITRPITCRWGVCGLLLTLINIPVSIFSAGYDFESYDRYANLGGESELHFFEPTVVGRPGVISIEDGYLTFRWIDLLLHPQIDGRRQLDPRHRGSVWTQLYARANFAQFERHPRSWQTDNAFVLGLARATFILALYPMLLWLIGTATSIVAAVQRFRQLGVAGLLDNSMSLALLISLGYLAFIVKFTASYRDFSAMKFIYILPGALPMAMLWLQGANDVWNAWCHTHKAKWMMLVMLWLVPFLYVSTLVALIGQLWVTS